jgi:hypothetical protein
MHDEFWVTIAHVKLVALSWHGEHDIVMEAFLLDAFMLMCKRARTIKALSSQLACPTRAIDANCLKPKKC